MTNGVLWMIISLFLFHIADPVQGKFLVLSDKLLVSSDFFVRFGTCKYPPKPILSNYLCV